jgi:colanic acid biosynthesis glycosyl transferase WcaI
MKLLVYGLNFWPELTGIGKYSGEMASWLAGRGHAVDVVTAPPYYPGWQVPAGYSAARYQRETVGTVTVTRCPLWVPRRLSTWRRLVHLASFALASLPPLWRALRARPDVLMVVVPTMFVAPGALLLARLFGVPAWIHVQDFEVDVMFSMGREAGSGGLALRLGLAVESRLLAGFKRASSITPPMVRKLVAKGVAPERCVEFPNWVDLSAVFPLSGPNPFRAALGLAADDVLVLYAGNMGEKQGLDIVIEAARLLAGQSRIRFVLAGGGGARARLEAGAAGLANVAWLPLQPQEQLNEMLNAADVHVLPQRADAADLMMPSKLTGMLASGRATVGTAAPDTQLGQVLDEAGRRVAPGDATALAATLQELALDAPLRASLGQRGRAYAERHFARDAILARFEQHLLALAAEDVTELRSSP